MGGQDEASTRHLRPFRTTLSAIFVHSVTIAIVNFYADDATLDPHDETLPPCGHLLQYVKINLSSQTAEAMQAILDDLTMEDQFSIIDFNHNVRCWREDLVPASPIQTEDAKNYIQNIRPAGGSAVLLVLRSDWCL